MAVNVHTPEPSQFVDTQGSSDVPMDMAPGARARARARWRIVEVHSSASSQEQRSTRRTLIHTLVKFLPLARALVSLAAPPLGKARNPRPGVAFPVPVYPPPRPADS